MEGEGSYPPEDKRGGQPPRLSSGEGVSRS
jgi:hypothetical protein